MNDKPKRDYSYLKKYQFGQPGGNKIGKKPKGVRNRKTELTEQILVEAMIIDPDSGKKMTLKKMQHMLSKKIWKGSDKVLLDVISRKLGPIPTQQITIAPTFRIVDAIETKADPPDDQIIDAENIETYALPGSSNDVTNDND